MDELIKQIRAATEADFYYLALMGALMLPDICGALASENGRATASEFKDWLIANVPEQAASAAEIYGLSGARYAPGKSDAARQSLPNRLHASLCGSNSQSLDGNSGQGQGGLVEHPDVCRRGNSRRGGVVWEVRRDRTGQAKHGEVARLRPEGLRGHVGGGPVIA